MATMKKAEIQATAKANIISEIIPDTARQIGVTTYAMPTEVDGITCWVKVALTCGNPIGTEKAPAFDIEQACANWKEEKADKERAAAKKAAEKERKERKAQAKAAKEKK